MSVRTWAARRWPRGNCGNAIVEFVVIGVLTLVPLIYLLLAIFDVQRNVFAVTQAAREAGRAAVSASTVSSGQARAQYAAELALADQGIPPLGVQVRYAPRGSSCAAAGPATTLEPGQDFAVCVTRTYTLPGVPGVLTGRHNTVTGRFIVHVDRFRARS